MLVSTILWAQVYARTALHQTPSLGKVAYLAFASCPAGPPLDRHFGAENDNADVFKHTFSRSGQSQWLLFTHLGLGIFGLVIGDLG